MGTGMPFVSLKEVAHLALAIARRHAESGTINTVRKHNASILDHSNAYAVMYCNDGYDGNV